ncbi:MAG TPA: PAS domain-containing sensor histidine kinase [Woeseiaceae bacterium]
MADSATPERLLRLFAEQSMEHAIIFLDPDGRITWWSPGAERIFGFPAKDALGRYSSLLFTPEEAAKGLPELEFDVARKETAAEDDRWLERADRSRFWAIGVVIPLRDERGEIEGFVKILRNRTDLREQIETLRNQAEAAEAESRRKDVFLSTLSHELRSPLGSLSNAAEIIRMTAGNDPQLEYPLRIVERQLDYLRRLIDDLLDLSRVAAGKITLERQTLTVDDVIRRAIEITRPLIKERRHTLQFLTPAQPIRVVGDIHRLIQVFENLLTNAAKYTPEGGRIWIKVTAEGDEAVIRVEDDGIGIPHDMLPGIFKLFTQVESARSQAKGGLGIGLSLVRQLVVMHSGSIQVRSDGPGKGSQFIVRLPLAREGGNNSRATRDSEISSGHDPG